jgi:hypothetical protein
MEGLPRSDPSNQSTRILRRVFPSRAFDCGFGRETLVPALWGVGRMRGIDAVAAAGTAPCARIMPVARTRARRAPAGRRDPTARRGRAARYHRRRIENWIPSLKPGWLSQCLAEFRRRKLFEDSAKLQRVLFTEDAFKTALRRGPTWTGFSYGRLPGGRRTLVSSIAFKLMGAKHQLISLGRGTYPYC